MFRAIEAFHQRTQQRVTLVATGALTNVALLMTLYEDKGLYDYLEAVVIMGGAIGAGNTNPSAEFNMEVDPEAAAIVFDRCRGGANSCGALAPSLVMVPIEVTHTALVTRGVLDTLRSRMPGPSPFCAMAEALLAFFADTYRSVFEMPDPPLHDPCAIAYVIAPELFTTRHCHVAIETASALSSGQTVVDLLNIGRWSEAQKNCTVATHMDVGQFWELMVDALVAADAKGVLCN